MNTPVFLASRLFSLQRKILFLLLLLSSQITFAAESITAKNADLDYRMITFYQDYYLNDDFSSSINTAFAIKVLTESAIENLKTTSITYSTSIEKLDVIDAYTLKADGKKIIVSKDNFQLKINKGNRDGGPVFSDNTTLTVVFPDVAVNDTLYFSYKTTQTEPMFPHNFTAQGIYSRQAAYDDAKVTINVPASLKFKHQAREMQENIAQSGTRKIITLAYKNPVPKRDDRTDFSVWDMESEPGFALSTFKDYESIALAYGQRALPKAVPDERVKNLSKDIIGTATDKKQQAKLLYNWVTTNITYAGNCIGVGAVVPHDTNFILDNKMGDCKDHATLLQALLTAVNIQSTQALINSGSIYKLPSIPMVSSVNHVINYLPEFDQFIDSTSQTTPFDMLPFSIADKPVLLVEHFKSNLKTPAQKSGDNKQVMNTTLDIQADGSVKGNVSLELSGVPAVMARSSWRNATQQQEQNWIENVLSNQGVKGSGSIQKDDPKPLESAYKYSIQFEKKGFIEGSGAGAFYISQIIPSPFPIYAMVQFSDEPLVDYASACSNGSSVENYTYHFPDNIKLLAKPDDFEINDHFIHYKATYKLENNTLTVAETFEDTTPGNVCSAKTINQQRDVLIKVADNLKSQVVYKK